MKRIKVKMNNPVYLGLSILEISKTLMHQFWYDIHIKTKDVYKGIAESKDHCLQEKTKKIGLMKDKLGGEFMIEFAALRPKTNFYLIGDGNGDKKAKGTKKSVIKRILKFNDYKNCSSKAESLRSSTPLIPKRKY